VINTQATIDMLSKAARTLQSELPMLADAKDALYRGYRKLTRIPHERDFRALRFIPEHLEGCYLDVGANRGQSIESIKVMRPAADVIAFEPNALLADRLRHRYADRPDVTVHPFGLADAESRRTLFVPTYRGYVYDGLASFDREQAEVWLSPQTLYRFAPDKLVLHEMQSRTVCLDSLDLGPIFIKIDVQGYEYQVVKGGMETIKRYQPVLLIEDVHWETQLGALLRQLGYEQYLFTHNGLYRADPAWVLNSFLMTPRRAETV
jgi:FkbM family methyltransferase